MNQCTLSCCIGPASQLSILEFCCSACVRCACWLQVVFSCGLMLSSFKGMDFRREGVMRQIQESHRQTLIQELKRVIEQKDAFMSSVSHELRTPLNGIIGAAAAGCSRRTLL
eukprot:GHRQ01039713.1.p2 GENE.GHRQ01039713.1~~GHRQ01039713.1.p2  ORF type:complete len:112 (-),score=48.84 GHRQ01039713.1:358-693(-)